MKLRNLPEDVGLVKNNLFITKTGAPHFKIRSPLAKKFVAQMIMVLK